MAYIWFVVRPAWSNHAIFCCNNTNSNHNIIMDTHSYNKITTKAHAKLFSTSALSSPLSRFANY